MGVVRRPSQTLVIVAAVVACATAALASTVVSRDRADQPTTLQAGGPKTTTPELVDSLADGAVTTDQVDPTPPTTSSMIGEATSSVSTTTTTTTSKSKSTTTTTSAARWRSLPAAERVDEAAVYLVSPDGRELRKLVVDSALVWGASFAPDGARVAFITADRLDVIGIDGTARRTLVDSGVAPVEPRWSPDGTSIAFVRRVDGIRRSAIVGLRDGVPRLVAPEVGGVRDVDWHPAGSEIVIAAEDGIRVGAPDGGVGRQLHATPHLVTQVRWSPSGHRLLFVTNGRLWTFNPESGNVIELGLDGGTASFENRWSPDGSRIALGLGLRLALFHPDGGRDLVESPALAPAWSPDGQRLVVRRQTGIGGSNGGGRSRFDLVMIRPDGSDVGIILADQGEGVPSFRDHQWRPQGDVLLFGASAFRPDYSS